MADFEGNVGPDLAADRKREVKEEEKLLLEFKKSKATLPVELKKEKVLDDDGNEIEEEGYSVYFPFQREDGTIENIKIAVIDAKGTFNINWDILKDEKFSKTERENLEKLLNGLGLDQDKVDINKMQEKMKELEEKQKEKNKDDKEREDEETNRDDNEGKEEEEEKEGEDQEEKDKDLSELEKEGEIEVLAKRKKIPSKNICKIRRDSQFYKNYPNIPKTAYFYLNEKDEMCAEYIDTEGNVQKLEGFEEIKDNTTQITRFGDGNENIKKEMPYKVMTAEGLNDKNQNTQSVRMAMYKDDYGYLKVETIHQGKNGMWEGKNIETQGRDLNTKRMNKMISEENKEPETGKIANRYEELKQSGYSQDGIHLDDMSKRRKIEEYMQDGYTNKEANAIYDYVTGALQLKEEDAKEKVNEETANKRSNDTNDTNNTNEENDGGRTPGGDALERRNRW